MNRRLFMGVATSFLGAVAVGLFGKESLAETIWGRNFSKKPASRHKDAYGYYGGYGDYGIYGVYGVYGPYGQYGEHGDYGQYGEYGYGGYYGNPVDCYYGKKPSSKKKSSRSANK